ncbi:hypothetical protein EX349_06655 [Pseudomonas protegens]|uniref:hypothetical protein n=1 Tax=Pseudomonas protegens TaxID=380021 RepID=UPI0013724D89|nr:hypothetical protein [Pseudomonas protegens]NAN50873.1 hypothetical protein [Pseudomonas protegens]NUE77352.1 hypothetical protein [Pseudomonas protegens]
MPTETQLEQRVAALQSDLNARDQALGDAATENNERELSRRDWFEAAQAAERRVEELQAEVDRLNRVKMALAEKTEAHSDNCSVYRTQLAERDALLRDSRMYVATCRAADPEHHRGVLVRIEAALSASAEQSAQKYNDTLLPFVALMRKELHANAGKGDRPGWLAMSSDTCLLEIIYHFGKLQASVKRGDSDGIAEYGADVANMCMMLLDICGVLAFVEQPEPVSSTSDKYKAELYDEVWQLAKDMGFGNVTDALMKLKKQPAPVAVVLPFTEKVICKLERFQECADDGQDVDIGRHWLDLITQLGLLNWVQRSPALWEMTQQGEDALELSRQSAKSR